ncbi:hypothetical protein [Phreatobacter oligotrophus]|uniref:Uncharacterized protein n=1 Tax=Phreatobacter oligotrophus TaxID=1122261 RepID=A0A2T4ZGZ7_9HYPH|nr:hypothetical protein [Phreatobacter oligotrophus]PTM61197.1 hypothetical protein C8P69_102584 [Phreatobacter oligotrophus]
MIHLAQETQDMIMEKARLAGTSPDALVRAALAAIAPTLEPNTDRRADLSAALARLDGLPRSADERSVKAILEDAWTS